MKLFLKMALCSKAKSKMTKGMVLEYRYGLMVQSTKDIGRVTKQKEEASFITLMETYMMENGNRIKLMALEFIHKAMGHTTVGNGMKIGKKVLDQKLGLMVVVLKVTLSIVRKKASENIHGLMAIPILGVGQTT